MTDSKEAKLLALVTELKNPPVWVTIKNCQTLFGLGRSKINELMNARLVKYTQVKDKHQVRGRILINYQSMVDLFESWATPTESTNKSK